MGINKKGRLDLVASKGKYWVMLFGWFSCLSLKKEGVLLYETLLLLPNILFNLLFTLLRTLTNS